MKEEKKKLIRIRKEGTRGGERSGRIENIEELWKKKKDEMEKKEDKR